MTASFIVKNTILNTFLERVKQTPDLTAFVTKNHLANPGKSGAWKKISFREFHDECRELSHGFLAQGVEPKECVVLLSTTRYEWTLSDIAILSARGITVPIYPSNTAEDMGYVLNHCEAKIAIFEDIKQLQKVQDLRQKKADALPFLRTIFLIDPTGLDAARTPGVFPLDDLRRSGREHLAKHPDAFHRNIAEVQPSDLFTICYTSGTTGVPKGVMLTQDAMVSVMEDVILHMGKFIRADRETILSFLPYSHILGRMESMMLYTFGWKTAFAESFDKLMVNLSEIRPTIIFVVPRVFEKAYNVIKGIVDSGPWPYKNLFRWGYQVGLRHVDAILEDKPRSLKLFLEHRLAEMLIFKKVALRFGGRLSFAISGGAPLPIEVGEFFKIMGLRILEGYGLTETCAPIAVNTPGDTRFGTVGHPFPEVLVKIADDGEILIKSRKCFIGYFKNPDATAEALVNGWFHTGDIGYIDSDGFIHITDRKKDLLVTAGGKNIAPQKLENLLKLNAWINQVVVHGDRRNYLTALFTLDQPTVIKFANDNNILFSDFKELVKNPRIIAKVQAWVDETNKNLANYETIKKFVIHPQDLTIAGGELTPSLKVRRKIINERYKHLFDALYEASPIKHGEA